MFTSKIPTLVGTPYYYKNKLTYLHITKISTKKKGCQKKKIPKMKIVSLATKSSHVIFLVQNEKE